MNRASLAIGRLEGPRHAEALPEPLRLLCGLKNGFRALDDALLVLPAEATGSMPGIAEWNAPTGWRRWFDLDHSLTFFAMDVTLRQFAIDARGQVRRFDPLTDTLEPYAADLDHWAERVIAGDAGQQLARAWVVMHRRLDVHERLVPQSLGRGLAPMHLTDAVELVAERTQQHEPISREVEVYDVAW